MSFMLNKPRSFPAVSRLLAFTAIASFYTVAALSGCGGGGSNDDDMTNPSPSPSVSTGEPGRGGALSDGCSRAGAFITQPGWSGQCGASVQPTRKWTVLLYMNGANDLEEYGNLNLNQIEQYGSDNNVTFVAQFKRIKSSASYDDKSDGDWSGARRFVLRRDNNSNSVTSPIVSTRADIDMGDPNTLQEFVQWGVKTFPAEHYAIVLWNHGAGWRSRSTKPVTRGFSYDDEKDTHIDTIEVPEAIRIGNGRKWDLVAWDSSLMQILEVAHEIKEETNWIVGSEESPPGRGYPYHLWVDKLINNPDADARFVGEAICDAMIAGYGNSDRITQSLLDTSKIAPLTAAVNDFGAALLAAKAGFGDKIADARESSEYFDYDENKDLLDFARLVKENVSDPAVQSTATRVEEAARAVIVKSVHKIDHPNAQGVAIYLPSPAGYRRDDISQANGFGQRYTELLFARDAPNWQSFLSQGPQ